MKCALNNESLYKAPEIYICVGCALEKHNGTNLCGKLNLCDHNTILKRSHFQSDIFKI